MTQPPGYPTEPGDASGAAEEPTRHEPGAREPGEAAAPPPPGYTTPSGQAAPVFGAPTSGPPVSGPPVSGAPSSGPPVSGAPSSGPPTSGAPSSGPPVSGPPGATPMWQASAGGAPVWPAPPGAAPVHPAPVPPGAVVVPPGTPPPPQPGYPTTAPLPPDPPTSGPGYPGQPAYGAPQPTSGPGYPGYPGQPAYGAPQPTSGAGGQTAPMGATTPFGTPVAPQSGPPGPGQPYPPGPQPYPPVPAPRKRRGALITTIVLAVAIVLCGGGATGAYFLVKRVDGKGQSTPTAAVQGFLSAVFVAHDVDRANTFVCAASRDKAKLSKKVNELRSYAEQYKSPQFSWPAPTVEKQSKDRATLVVPVKFSTSDDRVAEKKLRFLTVNESGWWVCEVGEAS
jgi:hypothetical protein